MGSQLLEDTGRGDRALRGKRFADKEMQVPQPRKIERRRGRFFFKRVRMPVGQIKDVY